MRKIAIYGKGGIGKSTTVSNLSVAFSKLGYKVMQIGCDPKADSTRNLTNKEKISTVLDVLKENDDATLEELVHIGDSGVLCVEAGGPLPGIGCAGRGIITAFEKLDELDAYEEYEPDIVLYDVLGDVVCGGFSMPIRNGYADYVYIVTSGEMMSLYATTNISYAIRNLSKSKSARLNGLILNSKNIENELEIVQKAAKEIDTIITHQISRDPITQKAEDLGKTVMEIFDTSEMAEDYITLAKKMLEECKDV